MANINFALGIDPLIYCLQISPQTDCEEKNPTKVGVLEDAANECLRELRLGHHCLCLLVGVFVGRGRPDQSVSVYVHCLGYLSSKLVGTQPFDR